MILVMVGYDKDFDSGRKSLKREGAESKVNLPFKNKPGNSYNSPSSE